MVSKTTCAAARCLTAPGLPACSSVVSSAAVVPNACAQVQDLMGRLVRTKCSHQRLAACFGVEKDPGLGGGPEAAVEARAKLAVKQRCQEAVGGQPQVSGERQARLRCLEF